MGFEEEEDYSEEIDFGSQLSLGSKGMLINDNWITWQCDKSGFPHHDYVAEKYFRGCDFPLTAAYWFDGSLNIFSLYPLFDEITQIPLRNIYGNISKINQINIESEGEVFAGTFAEYKKAEQVWEEQNEPVSNAVAWVRANCRFAKNPQRFIYPRTSQNLF